MSSRRHKRHTSTLITHKGRRALIDFGKDRRGKIGEVALDAIFLIHAHDDHVDGLKDGAPCPVYATSATWDRIHSFDIRERRALNVGGHASVGELRFEPVDVIHSKNAPAVVWRVSADGPTLFYPGHRRSPGPQEEARRGRFYVGDGATMSRPIINYRDGGPNGHTTIRRRPEWYADAASPGRSSPIAGRRSWKAMSELWVRSFANGARNSASRSASPTTGSRCSCAEAGQHRFPTGGKPANSGGDVSGNSTTKRALVIEGGGMRGIFASGVLDAFHEADHFDFDLVIGASAGACTGACYLARQHGRNRRIFLTFMSNPRFISGRRFLAGGSYMDLDWLWDVLDAHDPLDVKRALADPGIEFVAAATCAQSGEPLYLEPVPETLNDAIKGSSAIPLLYRGRVHVDGRRVLDGGVADPIPVREAYRRGARDILVIRSRPADFVKESGRLESRLAAALFRDRPPLARAVLRSAKSYAAALRFIDRPPVDARVLQVAPVEALRTGRTGQDRVALEADYRAGLAAGHRALADWERLLGSRYERAV